MAGSSGAKELTTEVSAADLALYDRQIRLWGFDAQQRLQNGRVLLVELSGVHTEIAKNLVLAGIGHLHLLGHRIPRAADLAAQFLVSEHDAIAEHQDEGENEEEEEEKEEEETGQETRQEAAKETEDGEGRKRRRKTPSRETLAAHRLRELNPRVHVKAEQGHLFDGRDLDAFLSGFHVVSISGLAEFSLSQLHQLAAICRRQRISFVLTDSSGMSGFSIIDSHGHQWFPEKKKASTSSSSSSTTDDATPPPPHNCPSLEQILSPAHDWSQRKYRFISPLLFTLLLFLETGGHAAHGTIESALQEKARLCNLHKAPASVSDELFTSFFHLFGREFAPICAIVGGVVGQEIISLVGAKDQPLPNLFLFDGTTSEGISLSIP